MQVKQAFGLEIMAWEMGATAMTDENQHESRIYMQEGGNAKEAAAESAPQNKKPVCGIIRPISDMGGAYTSKHWEEVEEILAEPLREAGFEPRLVSNAAEISVIQATIVKNLYDSPIVICDVSGKNPNVMFELGLRLAFDKPTIIIKDENTGDSFDTAPIERFEYSSSLHYPSVVQFKEKLKDKILATRAKAEKDENYSPFLRYFGELVPAKISKQEVSQQQFWAKQIQEIEEKLDLVLKNLARQEQEIPVGILRRMQPDKEREIFERSVVMKGFSKAKRYASLQEKLRQARKELPYVNSAAALARKEAEIERLETEITRLEVE